MSVKQPGSSSKKEELWYLNLFTADTLILPLVPFIVSAMKSTVTRFLPTVLSHIRLWMLMAKFNAELIMNDPL
jgi:hypothetical protein